MNVDSHKRTLAIIHLAVGFLKLIVFGIVGLLFASFLPFIENEVIREEGPQAALVFDFISSAFVSILILVAIFTAIP